jgi:hypothetical protein
MKTKVDRLLGDIGDHYSDRLIDLTADTLDTCKRMRVPYRDAAAMIGAVLSVHMAEACSAFHMTPEAFMKVCEMAAEGRFDPPRKRAAKR